MEGWVKKHFIPHKGNNHAPHILRKRGSMIVLGAALIAEAIFLAQIFAIIPNSSFLATILPDVLVDLTNRNRQESTIAYLEPNEILAKAARLKAEDMARKSYFSHESPDGSTPWDWIDRVGYAFTYAGENLAVNFVDSEDVMGAWMESKTHKKNILNPSFKEIGIGTATGIYKERVAIFVVQMLASPASLDSTRSDKSKSAIPSVIPDLSSATSDPPPVIPAKAGIQPEDTVIEKSVLGVGIAKAESRASIPKKVAASPKKTTNTILLALSGMIFAVLLYMLVLRAHIKHPILMGNAVLIVTVLSVAVLINRYLSTVQAQIL